MPAVAPYIPNKQADRATWFANFSSLITASPSSYGLLTTDAANIATTVAAWQTAYDAVTSPATKTAATVSAKNTQNVDTLAIVRTYAQVIANNPGVTSANKIALGLNPKTSTPSPITPPTTNPILNVQSLSNLSAILRYRDSAASVSVKSKPYGVKQCRIFGTISTTPVTVPVLAPMIVAATKSPATVSLAAYAPGGTLYLWAQWATQSGGLSPFSPIISLTVPALS